MESGSNPQPHSKAAFGKCAIWTAVAKRAAQKPLWLFMDDRFVRARTAWKAAATRCRIPQWFLPKRKLVLQQYMVAHDQRIHAGAVETPDRVRGRVYNRFAHDVERSVQDHGHAAAFLECFDDRVEPGV